MKRVAVLMDLSGLGRCALGVAMPVLSAMGIQACAMPTAVLSAHTGGFGQMAKRDLSGFLREALAHWTELGIAFDAVSIGYLAADTQLSLTGGWLRQQKAVGSPYILFDPAMADHGKLYRGISAIRPGLARALCAQADLITPNLTEALLLLGQSGSEAECPISEARLRELLCALLGMGCRSALITGVALEDGRHVNAHMAHGSDQALLVPYEPAEGIYPGTGDLFSSVLLGALLRGEPMESAVSRAAQFIRAAIEETNRKQTPAREGVLFEGLLGSLI